MGNSKQERLWIKWSVRQAVGVASVGLSSCFLAVVYIVETGGYSSANRTAAVAGAVSVFFTMTLTILALSMDIRFGRGPHCAQCHASLEPNNTPQFCPNCGSDVTVDGATTEGKPLSQQVKVGVSAAILSVGIPIFLIATLKS